MMLAECLLAWSVVAVSLSFAVRLLAARGEERFARGLFAATRDR